MPDVAVCPTRSMEAIRRLRRVWADEDAGQPIDDPDFVAAFARWWDAEGDRRRYWVVEVDGDAVGMASVVEVVRMPTPGRAVSRWGYVHQVYVLPEHRDAGLGRRLLDAVVDACRADGYSRLVLSPRARSIPFYERLGFRPAEELLLLPLE